MPPARTRDLPDESVVLELDESAIVLDQEEAPASPAAAPAGARAVLDAERLAREVEALGRAFPAKAALLLATQACQAMELDGDVERARSALGRAAKLAPDARPVAMARRFLAERAGKPRDALAAARAELPLCSHLPERAALLWRIAALEGLLEEGTLRELVALEPRDLGARMALAVAATQRKSWRAAAEAWEALAVTTEDGEVAAALLAAAGDLRDVFLNEPEPARLAYDRARQAEGANVAALAALESMHFRARAWVELAQVLLAQAGRLQGDEATAATLHERAGDVFWEGAADADAAIEAWARASAVRPGDPGPLEKRAALLEHLGRYAELPPVYEALEAAIADPNGKAAMALRLGSLYETRLEKPEEARACYQRALQAAPTFAAAAQALLALYRADGRWEELCALLLVEADRVVDPVQRADRYVAVAEVYEAELGKLEPAIQLYERALGLDPGAPGAFDALDRIHRGREDYAALIAIHERQIAQARDPRRARALRLALATLYHERVKAPERAAETLEAVLASEADELPTLMALARALADAGKWPAYLRALERQAALVKDESARLAALLRIAATTETRLGDPVGAIAAYERVLERAPRNQTALEALVRLEAAQGRWEQVVVAERRRLAACERVEEAVAILDRIGQLSLEPLGRPEDAARAYEEALAKVPTHLPSRLALERLLRGAGRYGLLADLFVRLADATADPAKKAALLCRAAALRELHPQGAAPAPARHSGRPAAAAALDDDWTTAAPAPARDAAPDSTLGEAKALYERAIAALPTAEAFYGLARLAEARRDWRTLDAVYGQLEKVAAPSGRTRLMIRRARLEELRLGRPAKAAELYEAALAAGAGLATAVDRLRMSLGEKTPGSATSWLARVGEATRDKRLALGCLRLRATSIEHAEGPGAAAAEAWGAALAQEQADVYTLEALVRSLSRVKGEEASRATALAVRARQAGDPATQAMLFTLAGQLHEWAGRAGDAEAAWNEALGVVPGFLPPLAGLWRLAEQGQDARAMADLAARMAAAAADPEGAAILHEVAGDLQIDRLRDLAQGIASYRASLTAFPGRARVRSRLLSLLEQTGDWAEAVAVIGTQIEAIREPRARGELLVRRARIQGERLGDLPGAIGDLDAALRVAPDDLGLLELKARFCETARHWPDAAAAWSRLATLATKDPPRKRTALLAQARVFLDGIPDPARARAALEEVLKLDANDREACRLLARLVLDAGDRARAIEMYRRLADGGAPGERVADLCTLAELERARGDAAAADAAILACFPLAADDAAVLPTIEAHLAKEGRWEILTRVDEAIGRSSGNGILPLRLFVARHAGEDLKDGELAGRQLRAAVHAFPRAPEARVALGTLLVGRDDTRAVRELRAAIDLGPRDASAWKALSRAHERLRQTAQAVLAATAAALLSGEEPSGQAVVYLRNLPLPPAGALPPGDALRHFFGETRAESVRRVLALVNPYLHEIFRAGQDALRGLIPIPDGYPAATATFAVAAALEAPRPQLYRAGQGDPFMVLSQPRGLLFSGEHLEQSGLPAARFEAARALSRIAADSDVCLVLPPENIRALVVVATDPDADGSGVRELRKRLGSVLPRKVRKDLERLSEDESFGDLDTALPAWEEEERARSLLAGMAFSLDVRLAARAVAASAAPSLLRFAASETFDAVLRRLYP